LGRSTNEGIRKKAPRIIQIPLEPSNWILLENPLHKSSRSSRLNCQVPHLRTDHNGAKISKLQIPVNRKMAEDFVRITAWYFPLKQFFGLMEGSMPEGIRPLPFLSAFPATSSAGMIR
jgi:hypothetical protein